MIFKYSFCFGGLLLASSFSYADMIQPNNLIKQCASGVPERVALAIISQESGFNPYAIGVNRAKVSFSKPKNQSEAIYIAKKLISSGHNIDMGYAQINSANLKWLGLSVDQVFDPCTNLKAMQHILGDCYNRAGGNNRLQKAFSCYNTGNHSSGFNNGYVRKVTLKYNSLNDNKMYALNNAVYKQNVALPKDSHNLGAYANQVNLNDGENISVNAIANKVEMLENKAVISAEASDNKNASFGDVFTKSKNDIFY